jgi:protein SCO1/2
MMDRRFAEIQKTVSADPALKSHVRLLSVSFDPDADTPAQMAAHARKLNANPSVWRFATAPRAVVERFAATFGVNVIREADRTITHNMRTTVIGPDGRVVEAFDSTDWRPEQIVEAMRRSLAR